MDPFDQEPMRPAAEQALTPARLAATAAAALPAVGLGLLCLSQGIPKGAGAPKVDSAFHAALGITMLLLFGDVALLIRRSQTLMGILFACVLGFVAAFAVAVLAEVGGPPVLFLVMIGVVLWGLVAWRRPAR